MAGNSLDILVMNGINPKSLAAQPISLSFGPKTTRGAQAAYQKWLLTFLTSQGTAPGDTSYGTEFLERLKGLNLGDTESIKGAFNAAAGEVQNWMADNLQSNTLEPDEYVETAELLRVTASGTTIQLVVRLTTAAGSSAEYIVPLAQTNL